MNTSFKITLPTLIVLLAACDAKPPLVRVCLAVTEAQRGSYAAKQCQCIDELAHDQLGPERYSVLDAAARAAERDGLVSPAKGAVAFSDALIGAMSHAKSSERAIAAGDAALIIAKSAVRCN